jgi:hypothetical protein
MTPTRTVPAFTAIEAQRVHDLIAARVAFMMGRKFEEADWAEVYTTAKGIPIQGWSNLNIDVMYGGLGVEHKMVCYRSKPSVGEACGSTLMHPAATRSIRVPSLDTDPNEAMADILNQYARLIQKRREMVQATSPASTADMRTGWLLWQENLREFLYFEEPMLAPIPDDYHAVWNSRPGNGNRKGSTNLWIYEKATGRKRYSVTTVAGAKIQPYFDVPTPDDPNLYIFTVQGELVSPRQVRVWVGQDTARELQRLLGDLEETTLTKAVLDLASNIGDGPAPEYADTFPAISITIDTDAYLALHTIFPKCVSDHHLVQSLVRCIASR